MNSSERIGALMFKYVRKELSRKEELELSAWRNQSAGNEHFFRETTNPENMSAQVKRIFDAQQPVLERLRLEFPDRFRTQPDRKILRLNKMLRWAAVLVITTGIYWISTRNSSIKAGDDMASVISPEGTKDDLNSAMRDFKRGYKEGNAGVIHKMKNGRMILVAQNEPTSRKDRYYTLFTKRGGEYALELSDGTIIRVNAATTIQYPANMLQDTIHISIDGEAFFEIPETVKHRYMVNGLTVGGLRITVRNAYFNIMNYSDEPAILMTLRKGTADVRTDTIAAGSPIALVTGQQAKLDSGKLSVADIADMRDAIAWTENKTSFHNADIRTIMRFVARWYNADVIFEGNITDKKFTVNLPRNAKISELLEVLEKQGVRFTVHGKTITVTP